jgi:hypothetical protein
VSFGDGVFIIYFADSPDNDGGPKTLFWEGGGKGGRQNACLLAACARGLVNLEGGENESDPKPNSELPPQGRVGQTDTYLPSCYFFFFFNFTSIGKRVVLSFLNNYAFCPQQLKVPTIRGTQKKKEKKLPLPR